MERQRIPQLQQPQQHALTSRCNSLRNGVKRLSFYRRAVCHFFFRETDVIRLHGGSSHAQVRVAIAGYNFLSPLPLPRFVCSAQHEPSMLFLCAVQNQRAALQHKIAVWNGAAHFVFSSTVINNFRSAKFNKKKTSEEEKRDLLSCLLQVSIQVLILSLSFVNVVQQTNIPSVLAICECSCAHGFSLRG